jgi:MFS family permease
MVIASSTESTELRRARAATTVVFFVTGGVFASWGARIPAVQDSLDLSPGELAVAIAGLEGGAVFGLPAGGALATRFGSRRSLRLGFAVYCSAMVAVAFAPGLGWLAVALAATAAATSVNDVAMNAQGVEVERRYGRPVLSGLHAGHSFGVLAGALLGTAAAAAGIGVAAHFSAIAATGLIAGLLATPALVDEPRVDGAPLLARPSGALAGLAAIAFCAFFIDGTATQWSAVHLRSEHAAGPALAAAAFAAFALAVAVGRLAGDRAVARFGRPGVVRAAGLIAAAGIGVAIAAPAPTLALAGWALLGAGVAIIAPAVLGAAPEAGRGRRADSRPTGAAALPPPVAIAAVTTVGYLGSFTGPPLVGALAEIGSLSAALGLAVAASLAIVVLASTGVRKYGA